MWDNSMRNSTDIMLASAFEYELLNSLQNEDAISKLEMNEHDRGIVLAYLIERIKQLKEIK